jgi:long-subunit fatty acid transport protein
MKKIVLTFAAAMAAMVMDAQVYLGGTLGFKSTSYDGDSSTSFVIKPEVGYNLNEDWSLGVVFGYGESGKDATKVKTLNINPYARYNAVKLDKVTLFIDGTFGYESNDSKIAGYKTNTWGVGVKPGVAVALNDNVSFVSHMGFLGYQSSKPDYDNAKATNTFGLKMDATSLDFGFYYTF